MQDRKYSFQSGALRNRASGDAVPKDEPVFVLRARDEKAVTALQAYADSIDADSDHHKAVLIRIDDFNRFAAEHPDRMKEPDTDIDGDEWTDG